MPADRPLGLALAALAVALLAGCTAAPESPGQLAESPPTTRWWSTGVDDIGSAIDDNDAATADDRLEPDEGRYCALLAATLERGDGLMPAALDAADARYQRTTLTFLAEAAALAPPEVAESWNDVHAVLGALLGSAGDLENLELPEEVDPTQVEASMSMINEHAASVCRLPSP